MTREGKNFKAYKCSCMRISDFVENIMFDLSLNVWLKLFYLDYLEYSSTSSWGRGKDSKMNVKSTWGDKI